MDAMGYESIRYERHGAVALITLDRPDRLNAWTPAMASEQASTRLLTQRVGLGRAGEMCLTGRLYDGAEAHRMGLADRLAASGELLDAALELGAEIAANPRPQLRMIKLLLTENALETDLRLVQEREHRLIRECWRSSEHRRAVEAFLAKRA